jgi:hypothetical protein
VNDNRPTESRFQLLLEDLVVAEEAEPLTATKGQWKNATIGYHSLAGHHISQNLHYPPVVLLVTAAAGHGTRTTNYSAFTDGKLTIRQ